MKRYRIVKYEYPPIEMEAESAQEACQKVGWMIDDCIIQELKPLPHTEVTVSHFPACDICTSELSKIGNPRSFVVKAIYDGVTQTGRWAYMCEAHFRQYGIGLGLGKGQHLVERKCSDGPEGNEVEH